MTERIKLKRRITARGTIDKRGGAQPGAGRPLGSANKVGAEEREFAASTGELPHEMALRISRAKIGEEVAGHKLDWEDIKWAMTLAAPFYGSKRHTTTWTGPPQRVWHIDPKDLVNMSERELAKLERILGGSDPGENGTEGGETPTVNDEEYSRTLN